MGRTTGTWIAIALWAASLAGCGGAGNVGDACSRPGSVEDCVDGAVCATDPPSDAAMSNPVWDTNICRALCAGQDDCPTGLECRGVTGAPMLRACQQPRPSAP